LEEKEPDTITVEAAFKIFQYESTVQHVGYWSTHIYVPAKNLCHLALGANLVNHFLTQVFRN